MKIMRKIFNFTERNKSVNRDIDDIISPYKTYILNTNSPIYFMNSLPKKVGVLLKEGNVGGSVDYFDSLLTDYNEEKKARFLSRPAVVEISEMLSRNNIFGMSGDILDVGCLSGEWTRYLAEMTGRNCTGIDVNPEIVEVLNKHNNIHNVNYISGDVENLPFRDASVGLVFVSGVLQYVPDFEGAISELYRVSSEFVFIGRLSLFRHHPEVIVYQDGKHKVWARRLREVRSYLLEKFDIIEESYSSEVWYVDNISEPVINSHFLLRRK
ncbi:MAG: methyltransferase family protein [Proteobacteria bacterium]|nr:methyltransferase family protein [Pseudomonadota bacterium]